MNERMMIFQGEFSEADALHGSLMEALTEPVLARGPAEEFQLADDFWRWIGRLLKSVRSGRSEDFEEVRDDGNAVLVQGQTWRLTLTPPVFAILTKALDCVADIVLDFEYPIRIGVSESEFAALRSRLAASGQQAALGHMPPSRDG